MRVRTAALAFAVSAGCAPPALSGAGGPPTIHLLYPQPGSSELFTDTDDESALHMQLDADNVLRFTAVVAFENITFSPPKVDVVDGEAHWHLFVDAAYTPGNSLYQEAAFAMESPDFVGLHTLKVRLQQNDHAELDCLSDGGCTDADVEDKFEFFLDPPAADTGNGG